MAKASKSDSFFSHYIQKAKKIGPFLTAIVHPVTEEAIAGAIDAEKEGLIIPVFIGPQRKIEKAAHALKVNLSNYKTIDTEHSHAAAEKAVDMARNNEIKMIVKGSLHSEELLSAVLHAKIGLATDRKISHAFILEIPTYPKPLILSDAALNISPDLNTKRDIVQNAIDLAHSMNIDQPKVAVLSAIETINMKIQSTLDAACLCKMADRKQIIGGIIDGPLAFDNAISEQAAKTKGIISPVAGKADILISPSLDAGNMLSKQLEYLSKARIAGLVLGCRIPIVLTSRADNSLARMTSCALAILYSHYQQQLLKNKKEKNEE